MPSGVIKSHTFTPDFSAQLVVTCRYEAQGTNGGDWGAAYAGKCFVTQNGTTTYGNPAPMNTARLPYMVRHVFNIVAGSPVEWGLYGEISGAVAATFWNIDISAHLIR